MEQRIFVGFGGIHLAADTYGSEDAATILILPGGWQTRDAWRGVAEALANAGRHVICVDLRGHGDSGRTPDGRYDLDAFAGDLRAVLAQLPSRPTIIGAALGGWISIAVLGEGTPDLAAALVLVDAPPQIGDTQAVEMSARLREHSKNNPVFDPRMLESMHLGETAARLNNAAALAKLPTLIIRGSRSRISSEETVQNLAKLIVGSEIAEVEEAGHLVATDREDLFNSIVLDFLERRVPLLPPIYEAGSDDRTLRDALGCFGTGVTIVTARSAEGKPAGLTANSFTSVSLNPPLLLVCLANTANTLDVFRHAEAFAVNVLHIGQQPVSNRFASRGEDRFVATQWESWSTGAPIITNSLASFECERFAMHEAGDHQILIGRVICVRYEPRRDPLLYFRGKYRRLHFS